MLLNWNRRLCDTISVCLCYLLTKQTGIPFSPLPLNCDTTGMPYAVDYLMRIWNLISTQNYTQFVCIGLCNDAAIGTENPSEMLLNYLMKFVFSTIVDKFVENPML